MILLRYRIGFHNPLLDYCYLIIKDITNIKNEVWGHMSMQGAAPHSSSPHRKKVAGVNAVAQVAATEPKMEEESSAPCLLSSKGAPGPKAPAPRPTQKENSKEKT